MKKQKPSKIFDPNKIKIDEKSYENILIYYIEYMVIKGSKYVKINIVNPSYIIFSKANGYVEEINGNKYFTFVPTNESKEVITKYEEPWSKIRNFIRSITKESDDYEKRKFD